jgi:hypothetical protein
LKAIHQIRLPNLTAALAVVLLHAVAILAMLSVRTVLNQLVERPQNTVTTWIILPPEPLQVSLPKRVPSPTTAGGLPMAPLVSKDGNLGFLSQSVTTLPLLFRPTLTLPSLTPPTNLDARVFSTIGEYFSCNFVNYDKVPDAVRERCALRLSNLGDIVLLPSTYSDSKVTPFNILGAQGTFAITPPAQRPFDLLQASIGCAWEQGLCRRPQPDKFGFDPDDQKRLTAAAHFQLAKGLTLDVGGQGYMQSYLGGARPIFAVGVALTYRW